MENKIKVVCPKCQAKLNLPIEKMKSEVVRFRCPNCSTVLKVKKPGGIDHKAKLSTQIPARQATTPGSANEQQGKVKGFDKETVQATAQQDDSGEELVISDSADEESIEDTLARGDGSLQHIPRTDHANAGNMRKDKRVKFKKKVLVDNQIMVEALDISERGLFLHTGRSFENGSVVQLGIPSLTGRFDLTVQATVRHNHRGIGMGLQFVDIDESQRTKLKKLIDSLDKAARKELEDRKVILLAGGSDTARNINKSKLVLDGFYVLQATNADAVFDILKNETPDAMVLDWQETSFYSKGLLNQIRKTPQYDNVIVIVLAALTDAHTEKEILDAGAERYMAKMDTNPAKLSKTLAELIGARDG